MNNVYIFEIYNELSYNSDFDSCSFVFLIILIVVIRYTVKKTAQKLQKRPNGVGIKDSLNT